MRTFKRILSLLLCICLVLGANTLGGISAASGDTDFIKIAFVDCGRKYFTKDWLIAFVNEAAYDGFTHVELAFGNDGLRFLLDDMSLSVNGSVYSDSSVKAGIKQGNINYHDFGVNELTESEMNDILAAAAAAGVEIIPMINTPGHMNTILDCIEYCGIKGSYNNSAGTVDVTNQTAYKFTQALVQKYAQYFYQKGCRYFDMGCDEYANDVYSSGGMGFGNLYNAGKYGYFVSYVNSLAAIVKSVGMTPMAFNDGIYYNSTTAYGSFDSDIMVSYWSSGWWGYNVASASYIAAQGHKMINTSGDFYYVVGKNDQFNSNGYTYASKFSNTSFMGGTISNPAGARVCIWCDYPDAETETQIAQNARMALRAMALRMDNRSIDNIDTSAAPGGFSADGSINAHTHSFGAWVINTPATCVKEGSKSRTCSGCGAVETETIELSSHKYISSITQPTCSSEGYTTYTCTVCRDSYIADRVETLAHSYNEAVTAPTCTTEGYTTYTCSVCGDSYTAEPTESLGHDFGEWYTVTPASCTEKGVSCRDCSRCSENETSEIATVAHSYEETVIEATPGSQGYTLHTCTECGSSYTDNYTDFVTDAKLSVSSAVTAAGRKVVLKVSAEKNPGIASFILGFDFDSAFLSLDSIEISSEIGGMTAINEKAVWLAASDVAFEGEFMTLTFTVKETAAAGDYSVGVTYNSGDIVNTEEQNIEFNLESGIISVLEHIPGDINADGVVNGADLVRLQKYLAGIEGITVNPVALDVNNDSLVNNVDLVLLMRYLSGEKVTIY